MGKVESKMMKKRIIGFLCAVATWSKDQRGITGLETAIVLIAFVVVASVFAFAVLSTGLLSSEKSKQVVLGGLAETSATLTLRGSVIGVSNASDNLWVNEVRFTLTSAAQAAEAVDLSPAGTVLTYLDKDHAVNCDNPVVAGTPKCSWAAVWIIGSGNLVDPNEQVDVTVTLSSLTPNGLNKSKEVVLGGLAETSATLTLRGSVIGEKNSSNAWIDKIRFTLTSAAQAAEAVDLSSAGTVVTYLDKDQAINCGFQTGSGSSYCTWDTAWIIGSGSLVDPNEQVDVTVDISQMTPTLKKSVEFTIQIRPSRGAVVIVNRTTPAELKTIMDLQ